MRRIALVICILGSLFGGAARAATPAIFQVGFAVRDITPTTPQYLGGFGYDDPVSVAHDPLQVRAMAVRSLGRTVLFAIVDTQGWFAGNQEGPWGVTDARTDAANALSASGVLVASSEIIVSSTHSHAAPTIMGIWGKTDAVYLKRIHDQTVDALVYAGTHTQDAELYSATADISSIIASAVSETDVFQGWRIDGRTPILWARDPSTKATIGLYANVPVHADIVIGIDEDQMSADHIGVERVALDAMLGGTSVVAMGTLGRQESFIQASGFAEAERVGGFIANEIMGALAKAEPITDPTVLGAEQYILVPATNPLLAALNVANATGEGGPDSTFSTCDVACPIDRAILPPYSAGAAFGTWVTALRIGQLVYATEPGEAFPEVSTSIRQAMGAAEVRIVGMAQDQLGYFYPPETYPWTFFNNSDFHIYNASLLLADAVVAAQTLNALALGFTPAPAHETSQFDDLDQAQRFGVQFIPSLREHVAGTLIEFEAAATGSAFGRAPSALTMGTLPGESYSGSIAWDFGDGATATGGKLVSHAYSSPGSYLVTATIDNGGELSVWKETIVVDPPLVALGDRRVGRYYADLTGGSGTILAAHWQFSDGSTADGLNVPSPGAVTAIVTVIDSAGNAASVSV